MTFPHDSLEPVLRRTLGVVLFQEQAMQMAIHAAGFTATEADRLRQAMSSKRSPERMEELREALMAGMAAKGIAPDVAEDISQRSCTPSPASASRSPTPCRWPTSCGAART